MTTTAKHQILIVGGGTAGITVAARMLRKGYTDVAVIEPSNKHYYQPLWTLVGGGQAKASTTERAESSVMPKEATWIKNAASGHLIRTTTRSPAPTGRPTRTTCSWSAPASNSTGIAPRGWRTPSAATGCRRTTGSTSRRAPGTSSATLRSGTAVFTMPSGAIKCAGAPQKIAYLASRLLAKAGRAQGHRRSPRRAGAAAVRHSRDRRQPRQGHRRLRHHRAHQLRGDLRRRGRHKVAVTSVGQGRQTPYGRRKSVRTRV